MLGDLGNGGEVPQISLDLVTSTSKSNTDFIRVSKLLVETQSGIRSFDTYFSSTPLWWLLWTGSVFIGCRGGSTEGGGKLEEGSAFSGLLGL